MAAFARGRGQRSSSATSPVQSPRGYVAKSPSSVLPPHRRRSLELSKARLDRRNMLQGSSQSKAIVIEDYESMPQPARPAGFQTFRQQQAPPAQRSAPARGAFRSKFFSTLPPDRMADISAKRSLHVKGVPHELNNPQALQQHFRQFGEVSVKCNPAKYCATAYFQTHVSGAISSVNNYQSIFPRCAIKLKGLSLLNAYRQE